MNIRMYAEIIFSDSTIDKNQLTELLNGIIFNGGNISQHIIDYKNERVEELITV